MFDQLPNFVDDKHQILKEEIGRICNFEAQQINEAAGDTLTRLMFAVSKLEIMNALDIYTASEGYAVCKHCLFYMLMKEVSDGKATLLEIWEYLLVEEDPQALIDFVEPLAAKHERRFKFFHLPVHLSNSSLHAYGDFEKTAVEQVYRSLWQIEPQIILSGFNTVLYEGTYANIQNIVGRSHRLEALGLAPDLSEEELSNEELLTQYMKHISALGTEQQKMLYLAFVEPYNKAGYYSSGQVVEALAYDLKIDPEELILPAVHLRRMISDKLITEENEHLWLVRPEFRGAATTPGIMYGKKFIQAMKEYELARREIPEGYKLISELKTSLSLNRIYHKIHIAVLRHYEAGRFLAVNLEDLKYLETFYSRFDICRQQASERGLLEANPEFAKKISEELGVKIDVSVIQQLAKSGKLKNTITHPTGSLNGKRIRGITFVDYDEVLAYRKASE